MFKPTKPEENTITCNEARVLLKQTEIMLTLMCLCLCKKDNGGIEYM